MNEPEKPANRHSASATNERPSSGAPLERVFRVLNRETTIDSLEELRAGLIDGDRVGVDTSKPFALGFDTNAFFRLGLSKNGPAAVDYVSGAHTGPVIIPGQAIQEIWNNSLSVVQPQASVIKKKFDDLSLEISKLDQSLGPSAQTVSDAVQDLKEFHGSWIDPGAKKNFKDTTVAFSRVATSPYVPRLMFDALARIRKETKTPPGFLDSGFGDFFLWADYLYGLAKVNEQYAGAVLVTNDVKHDWSRSDVEHPILVAEVFALTGVPFQLWTLRRFQEFAAKVTIA